MSFPAVLKSCIVALASFILLLVAGPASSASSSRLGEHSHAAGSRVVVRFEPSTTTTKREALERGAGAIERSTISHLGARVLVVAGDVDAALARLRSSPAVGYAERDSVLLPTDTVPNDPYFPTGPGSQLGGEWGSFMTQAPQAWDLTTGSAQVVIADIDSGVASTHPDLASQFVP